jgi:hypothetical protein
MKKLAIAAAIAAATLTTGAHAQVASNADLYIGLPGGLNVEADCSTFPAGGTTFLSVATTNAASFLTGTLCLDPNTGFVPPLVLLQFGLTTSVATGRGGPGGTWFDSGTTDVYLDTGSGNWVFYATVDASLAGNQVDCLVNGGFNGTQPGLVWPATGPYFATLPGVAGPACYTNVLGMPAELHLFP